MTHQNIVTEVQDDTLLDVRQCTKKNKNEASHPCEQLGSKLLPPAPCQASWGSTSDGVKWCKNLEELCRCKPDIHDGKPWAIRIHSVKSKSKQSYNMGTSGSPSCTSTICNSPKGLKRKMEGTNRNMPKLYHSILLNIDCTCHALAHLPHDKFGQALLCPLLLAVFSAALCQFRKWHKWDQMSIGHHWATSQGIFAFCPTQFTSDIKQLCKLSSRHHECVVHADALMQQTMHRFLGLKLLLAKHDATGHGLWWNSANDTGLCNC